MVLQPYLDGPVQGTVEARVNNEPEAQIDVTATPAASISLSSEGEKDSQAESLSEMPMASEGSQESNQDVFESTASQDSQLAEIEAGQSLFLSQAARPEGLPQRPGRGRRRRRGQRVSQKRWHRDQF